MVQRKRSLPAVLAGLLILLAGPALAQDSGAASRSHDSNSDRLFLAFAEDASLVDNQWWEGQAILIDGDVVDATIFGAQAAFQPWKNVEVGGRVGFGSTDTPPGFPDGSGATDLDLWGKYHFGRGGDNEYAAGGVITVPTGDDAAGLGFDAFALSGFGALRHHGNGYVLTGHAGVQLNGDGRVFGSTVDLDGGLALFVGGGVIYPTSNELSLVGEFSWRGERFDGADDDARIFGGVNWRVSQRGIVRGGIGFGLTDGAPDTQVIAGYAADF